MIVLERLAETERLLKLYQQSEDHFVAVCASCPLFILPKYGLGKVLLARAQLCIARGQLQAARIFLRRGLICVHQIFQIMSTRPTRPIATRKLLNDLVSVAVFIETTGLNAYISQVFQENIGQSQHILQLSKMQTKIDAERWYDLGVLKFRMCLLSKERSFAEAAKFFMKAIRLAPLDPRYWNALGATAEAFHIRQHCIIRALQVIVIYLHLLRFVISTELVLNVAIWRH